jgi:hypothetical protein
MATRIWLIHAVRACPEGRESAPGADPGADLGKCACAPLYCALAVLDPIAFRCSSRKTERQEQHEKVDGHRQGRFGEEGPAHKLASLVTDLKRSRFGS